MIKIISVMRISMILIMRRMLVITMRMPITLKIRTMTMTMIIVRMTIILLIMRMTMILITMSRKLLQSKYTLMFKSWTLAYLRSSLAAVCSLDDSLLSTGFLSFPSCRNG